LDSIIAVVALSTLLALVLVFALSLRLRQREIDTLFRLGGSRATIVRLLAAEIGIIVTLSGVLCGLLLALVAYFDESIVRQLFI
jgi:putative ABC transport system permease protein